MRSTVGRPAALRIVKFGGNYGKYHRQSERRRRAAVCAGSAAGRKNLPTAKFEVPRLSEAAGAPVIFTLQALPYGRVQDISRLDQDAELQILLAGCIDPDLKSTPLQHKFGGITPAETLKAMLLPGEIADLSREVERLSGYRRATIEKVKNA